MSSDSENSPWMCHICGHSSRLGEGVACSQCYKITCPIHLLTTTVFNPASGLFELQQICVECQLKKQL